MKDSKARDLIDQMAVDMRLGDDDDDDLMPEEVITVRVGGTVKRFNFKEGDGVINRNDTHLVIHDIIAFVVFMLVKAVNKAKGPEPEAAPEAPAGPTQEELLADILVALKK